MSLMKAILQYIHYGVDDFIPLFCYDVWWSALQYVDSLYGSRMEGEEAYNWTQLNTAVAFIKMWLQEVLTTPDEWRVKAKITNRV